MRKFLRKFSAVIMSLLLCLTMLSAGITAGASDGAKLRVVSAPASAKAGEEVRVDIKAVGFRNVAGIQLKVKFGTLTFVSKESNYIKLDDIEDDNNSAVRKEDGIFSFVVTGEQSSDLTKLDSIIADDMETSLLTLVFKIPSKAVENQVYYIEFIESDTLASDTDEKLIPLKLTNGKVTVEPEPMTVKLINADSQVVEDTQDFDSNTADYRYTFDSAVSGSYILSASKPKYVTREYNITVTDGTQIQQSVEIYHPGDVNGSGGVNTTDVNIVYAYVKETRELTPYQLKCANVAGSGETVNINDVNRIYAHVKETNLLW